MKCPNCSTKNPSDSKFCNECGTELAPVSVTKTLQTPPTSPGKTISGKYKILSELGRGGMGVVYKAKDTRLKRTVALKFLPAELTKDKEAKKRFIQEAQAAAALEHPNICTVYEVDEADGQTYIAMSYIEGKSLRDKLKEGPLDIDEAKDIVLQVAEGLKEAHEKGIVHRDIKPANIMLTKKGQAKITDFGLAKLSWGVDLTKTSKVMGTVAYMSPEQARGEEIDHRTDIWSLGAMLYEMISGDRPFQKGQEQALIYAILNDKPAPLSLLRSDVPTHIEQVIDKALAKKATERYQDIQELIQDMKLYISFPKVEKSIVVLPFENLSPDPEQEYFCDGMTEEITSDLSKIHSLRVISRNSAMMFKGTRKSTKTIGKELDVQYVLEGSVRKAGNNLRITAQLIEAASDAHLWAEKFGGTLDDVFDIQEKVSRSIVDELKLKLSPTEIDKLAERSIENVQVYDFYLRARQDYLTLKEEGMDRAVKILENGLNTIGDNATLYMGLADVHYWYYEMNYKHDETTLQKAWEYSEKALSIEPDSAMGYYLLGRYEKFHGDAKKACQHINRAVSLDPNIVSILEQAVWMNALYMGKPDIAKPLAKRLLEIDPLTPINYCAASFVPWVEGRFDLMEDLCTKWYTMGPDDPLAALWYAWPLVWNNKRDEALKFINDTIEKRPFLIEIDYMRFLKFALEGNKSKALESLSEESINYSWDDLDGSWVTSDFYALIDEREQAIDWIEHIVDKGFINYPLFSKHDPFLKNIRGEPRFKKLMERVKHEWENFEV
jgi:serine/threonine protein kinase